MAEKISRQEEIAQFIETTLGREPGKLPNDIAKYLGVHAGSVMRVLPYMERTGRLLYEDDRGRLYIYGEITV